MTGRQYFGRHEVSRHEFQLRCESNGRQTFAEHTDHTSQQASVYDCGGQRVQTTAGSTTRTMVYDVFGQNIADYSTGSVERENIYRGGQLLATHEYAQIVTQNATWTNMVGVSASGNNLTKTAASGWGNGGAVSTQSIASGDGYAEFGTGSLDYGMYGLSHGDTDLGYPDIDYAFYTERDGGRVYVFENGVNRGLVGTFVDGDRLRVAVEGGVVKYRKNGTTLLYSSTVAPTYPLLIDTSLYSSNNTLTNVVISGNLSGGGLKYVFQDLQGSTRLTLNNAGSSSTIIARHDYLPFGEEIGSGTGLRTGAQGYGETDTNRQKYGLTERDDATGLDHTPWRKYESIAGRWSSPDPYNGSLRKVSPQSFNRYAYAHNDPVNFIDPTGLDVWQDFNCFTRGEFGLGVLDWMFGWQGSCEPTQRSGGAGDGRGGAGVSTGGQGWRTGTQKEKQPCDAQLPTDPEQLALVTSIMHEASSGWSLGKNEYGSNMKRSGPQITTETLVKESHYLASAIKEFCHS